MDDDSSTVTAVLQWLEGFPDGSLVPPACVVKRLRGAVALFDGNGTATVPVAERPPPACSWRERIWTVLGDTRLGVPEVCEVLGKSRDAVYRLTSEKLARQAMATGHTDPRLPHRKGHDGSLVFVASELRQWIEAHEEQVVRPPALFNERLKAVGE